ncbi:unnamed protein product [Adineta ricciae]|uniref:Uncharacterized protein n=1 Tax=Adineta ricciae TaxID=249248 RepID=A0A815P5X5_ADIRI|nr:unnamed protein product [Adineta ricciae]
MCSRSVSGSSLLSGYNEDDARETNGRSRREFEEIDAVLYNEEKPKRLSIKRICEEWSSRPHFRVRGRVQQIEKQLTSQLTSSHKQYDAINSDTAVSSTFDLFLSSSKVSSSNFNELNVLVHDNTSGRSSINSIEGSELSNNSDLDNIDDVTKTISDEHSRRTGVDSFDSDDDDDEDENHEQSSDSSTRDHIHQRYKYARNPQLTIKCMKDNIVHTLASKLLQRFLSEQQPLLKRYEKLLYEKNSIKLRRKLRPNSLPPHSLSQNRFSYPSVTNTQIQISSTPYRSTPDPDMKGLLLVTRLHTTNFSSNQPISTSPRKPRTSSTLFVGERTATSLALDKRNQQQISLIGTAVPGSSANQLMINTTSQNPTRQSSSNYRYRSATTSTTHTEPPNNRLPPINIERIINADQTTMNRSTTASSGMIDSVPPATRAVSGTSIGSNPSSAVKLRIANNLAKVQRTSRPLSISSINNSKDFNNLSSTSPTRSMTTTPAPSTSLRTAAITRIHQQQQQQHSKRSLMTTKSRPPPSPSILKLSVTHI